ncbi:MAG: TIGR03862 family flavoprotein [Pseudomonadota bacterium]
MAAEMLAQAGCQVILAEAKPSPGRKLLMAGKSGLNLTKDEPSDLFNSRYYEASVHLDPILAAFGNEDVRSWAEELGQELFTGSTGRVFPRAMKASPLLRAWLEKLRNMGVDLRNRWRWTGWNDAGCLFDTPEGTRTVSTDMTVLALGGASWRRLGSDGAWAKTFAEAGIATRPFAPSNAALSIAWSHHMERTFGAPLKQVRLSAGHEEVTGECVVTRNGLEGSAIYALTRPLRAGVPLKIDLMPDWSLDKVSARLAKDHGRSSQSNRIRKALGLPAAKIALLQEAHHPLPRDPEQLAGLIKALEVQHDGLRPLDEAISTAGGVSWDALTPELMLRDRPGTFVCGEMIDWEAPTGGYLITACLATGRWAGTMAGRYAKT